MRKVLSSTASKKLRNSLAESGLKMPHGYEITIRKRKAKATTTKKKATTKKATTKKRTTKKRK